MRIGVPVFPGSNCEQDVVYAFRSLLGQDVVTLWHRDESLQDVDAIIVPGGFSYGDYLRTGALACLSPIMQRVKEFAGGGGPVLGICNGFQILCESGLLPGALLENQSTQFISQWLSMRVETTTTPFTSTVAAGGVVTCPIAHFQGNYFCDSNTLEEMQRRDQIVFRYSDQDGMVDENDRVTNPNGSLNAIAGICNEQRNVVGLMPHPERAVEPLTGFIGGNTGLALFQSLVTFVGQKLLDS